MMQVFAFKTVINYFIFAVDTITGCDDVVISFLQLNFYQLTNIK